MDEWAAGIAHDLRAPVQALRTELAVLWETDDPQTARSLLERSQRRAARIEDLLDDMLAATGPEPEDVDADAIIAAVASDLDCAVQHAVGTIIADPLILRRLLQNLISNASRHGRPPIIVERRPEGILVGDSGPGLPADLAADLAAGNRIQVQGSRGLGLALSRMLAQRSGWDLTVHNGMPLIAMRSEGAKPTAPGGKP